MKILIIIGIVWVIAIAIYIGFMIHWYQPGENDPYKQPVEFFVAFRMFPFFMLLMSCFAIAITHYRHDR